MDLNSNHLLSDHFFTPLLESLKKCKSPRVCPILSDQDWLQLGISRVISSAQSGRGFLQERISQGENAPSYGHFFEALKSKRRLALCEEINEHICQTFRTEQPDILKEFKELNSFEIRAGDGHWHRSASHDPTHKTGTGKTTKYPVGHLYTLCLRTHVMRHLMTNDQQNRKKEHDMRALKRAGAQQLRQDVKKGKKLLMVWDSAAIDFSFWHQLKQGHGIYFICREKEIERMKCGDLQWDCADQINQGVIKDELIGSGNGYMTRRVTYSDPASGKEHIFITNEITLAPGLIAGIYRMRWDIEKVFDEVKNHLMEKKAWATSATAKSMQGHFIALTHNLMLKLDFKLQTLEKIQDSVEETRRKTRRKSEDQKAGRRCDLRAFTRWATRSTQRGLKFIRWLRVVMRNQSSWAESCTQLRLIYLRF